MTAALALGTACVHGLCPTCRQPAFVWLWMPWATPHVNPQPEGVHARVEGVITDLVHETSTDCKGVSQ